MAMSDYKVVQSSNVSSEIQSFRDVLIAFLGDNRNVSQLKSKISKWQSQFCLRENSKILKSWEKLHFFREKTSPMFFSAYCFSKAPEKTELDVVLKEVPKDG